MADNAVARETFLSLRDTIARIEGKSLARLETPSERQLREPRRAVAFHGLPVLPSGVAALDAVLDGGLPLGGMTEMRNGETRNAGALAGFALALASLCQAALQAGGAMAPLLWIGEAQAQSEAGQPYAPGLKTYGVDLSGFLLASPRKIADALWMAEAALSTPGFAAVVLEIRGNPNGFGLRESRRLHLRARDTGVPLLLLRHAGEEESSSALFRLHVEAAPAMARLLPDGSRLRGSLGNPVFHVTAEKSRAFAAAGMLIEWNAHDHRFYAVDAAAAAIYPQQRPALPVAQLSASAGRPSGEDPLGRIVAFSRAS